MELNATIFLQVFIFLTLLVWLSGILFAPIMRLFDEREQRIEGAKRIAMELNSLAEEKARLFQLEYDRARTDARHSLSEIKQAMEKEHSDALERVKAAAREKLLAADKDLLQQEKQIREDLMGKSVVLANDIVKSIAPRNF